MADNGDAVFVFIYTLTNIALLSRFMKLLVDRGASQTREPLLKTGLGRYAREKSPLPKRVRTITAAKNLKEFKLRV